MATGGVHVVARAVAVVEDDKGMRDAIRRVLEIEGYLAEAFGTAEEFLASGAAARADCLVLDIRLPGMSGLDLYEHLLAAGNASPAVFITAQPDTRLRAIAKQRAAPYLVKPFLGEALIDAVTRCVRPH